jgi:shikimate kinase
VIRASLFLIGFMGAGKTSVGEVLSRALGWNFVDLDDRVVARERRTIDEIFRESGEAAFRHAEEEALRGILIECASGQFVIALGGGAYMQPAIRAQIKESGAIVIFLDAPVSVLLKRCEEQSTVRPLRGDPDQFRRLYEARRPQYLDSSFCIDTGGKDVEAVSREIVTRLRQSHLEAKES